MATVTLGKRGVGEPRTALAARTKVEGATLRLRPASGIGAWDVRVVSATSCGCRDAAKLPGNVPGCKMHLRRRISYRDETLDHFSTEPASFWLRSRRWDFWVANELEAFAVIARHDIEHIEAVSMPTARCECGLTGAVGTPRSAPGTSPVMSIAADPAQKAGCHPVRPAKNYPYAGAL